MCVFWQTNCLPDLHKKWWWALLGWWANCWNYHLQLKKRGRIYRNCLLNNKNWSNFKVTRCTGILKIELKWLRNEKYWRIAFCFLLLFLYFVWYIVQRSNSLFWVFFWDIRELISGLSCCKHSCNGIWNGGNDSWLMTIRVLHGSQIFNNIHAHGDRRLWQVLLDVNQANLKEITVITLEIPAMLPKEMSINPPNPLTYSKYYWNIHIRMKKKIYLSICCNCPLHINLQTT